MIDRNSRDALALALRRYAAKRISNDELEDAVGRSKDNRGVLAIQDMAWQLYDDGYRHYAEGRHALGKDLRRTVARWVLFLKTDCEYSWPDYDRRRGENHLDQFVRDLFTAGRSSKNKQQRWQDFVSAGEFEVWHSFVDVTKSPSDAGIAERRICLVRACSDGPLRVASRLTR